MVIVVLSLLILAGCPNPTGSWPVRTRLSPPTWRFTTLSHHSSGIPMGDKPNMASCWKSFIFSWASSNFCLSPCKDSCNSWRHCKAPKVGMSSLLGHGVGCWSVPKLVKILSSRATGCSPAPVAAVLQGFFQRAAM